MSSHNYEVIVANIGRVYDGKNAFDATVCYNTYVGKSKRQEGRAADESVTLLKDGEIIKEHFGAEQND